MHSVDGNTWSNDQNQLIAAIRTYNPQSLIFVGDTGTAFESVVSGALAGPGLVQPGVEFPTLQRVHRELAPSRHRRATPTGPRTSTRW